MKFTKNDIFEKLKGELTKNGKTPRVSDRSIDSTLEILMPILVNDETELEDFYKIALPIMVLQDGNIEKDNADFIKKLKPVEETRKPDEKTPPVVGDETIAELKSKLEKLESMYETEKRNKTIGALKRSLKSKLKEKGVSDEEWLDTFIPELNITEQFDVDSKIDSYVKIYNKSKATTPPDVTPLDPKGGSTGSLDDLWKDFKK